MILIPIKQLTFEKFPNIPTISTVLKQWRMPD